MGPEQGSRPRLPKPLIRQGYYQWPKRLRVARVQPSQAARSAASSPHPLTLQGIQAVADNLISNVKYKVEELTGLEIDKINIFVEGVRVID